MRDNLDDFTLNTGNMAQTAEQCKTMADKMSALRAELREAKDSLLFTWAGEGRDEFEKQFRLLDIVLKYDELCREALDKGADMNGLFAIDAREKIGRAKMADADSFAADYDAIEAQMKDEIAKVIAGGEEA